MSNRKCPSARQSPLLLSVGCNFNQCRSFMDPCRFAHLYMPKQMLSKSLHITELKPVSSSLQISSHEGTLSWWRRDLNSTWTTLRSVSLASPSTSPAQSRGTSTTCAASRRCCSPNMRIDTWWADKKNRQISCHCVCLWTDSRLLLLESHGTKPLFSCMQVINLSEHSDDLSRMKHRVKLNCVSCDC